MLPRELPRASGLKGRAGSPAFIGLGLGDTYWGGGLAVALPGAAGTAENGFRAVEGADGVWRLTHDLKPGYVEVGKRIRGEPVAGTIQPARNPLLLKNSPKLATT